MVDFSTSSRRVLDRKLGQQWTVSRVLFRRGVPPSSMRIIHLGDALPRRSSALTRALALMTLPRLTKRRRREERFGRVTLNQHPYSSLLPEGLASPPVARLSRVGSYPTISPLPVQGGPKPAEPSAVSFLLRFPSGHPGSALPTSAPYGARTFLPRTVLVRRRSSVHLQRMQGSVQAPERRITA